MAAGVSLTQHSGCASCVTVLITVTHPRGYRKLAKYFNTLTKPD